MSGPSSEPNKSDPCCFCGTETPRLLQVPAGICESCACSVCRGFRRYDDRGFLYTGTWPALSFTPCTFCEGEGTKEAEARLGLGSRLEIQRRQKLKEEWGRSG